MELCNTKTEAHLLARELSRFLAIKAHDRDLNYEAYSPSNLVDKAWHALLLHPLIYSNLCMALCGAIIDHDPFGGDDTTGQATRYAATLARYQELFGHVAPEKQWPSVLVANTTIVQEITHENMMPNVPIPEIVTMQIKIRFSSCDSDTFILGIKSNETIYDVKLKICDMTQFPLDQLNQLNLIYYSKVLENDRPLSDYNIEIDKSINLVLETEFRKLMNAMMKI
jgi:hypothetical protein